MGKVITYEYIRIFIENESKSDCILLSKKYNKATDLLLLKCSCGSNFKTSWNNFKRSNKRQCNKCGIQKREKGWNGKPSEKFSLQVSKIVGSEYTFIEEYQGSGKPIKLRHNKCNSIQKISPSNFLRADEKRWQCLECEVHEKHVKEVFSINPETKVLGRYTRNKDKLEYLCSCKNIFTVRPNDLIRSGKGTCQKCSMTEAGLRHRKTHDEFLLDVSMRTDYEVISEYKTANEKITIKHKVCNKIFETVATNFIRGSGCPHCKSSRGESYLLNSINEYKIAVEREKRFKECKEKTTLPFDFFIDSKLLIEYDGQQHFSIIEWFGGESEFKNTTKRDRIKNQYCIDNSIPLLRIPYWEQSNIESILNTALMHFGFIPEDDSYDYTLIREWLVDSNWDHDAYITKCPKNIKDAAKLLTNSY